MAAGAAVTDLELPRMHEQFMYALQHQHRLPTASTLSTLVAVLQKLLDMSKWRPPVVSLLHVAACT